MATTPTFALPYPVPTDTPDVPRDIQALATKLDGTTLPLFETLAHKGVANGYAALDATGRIPVAQVPAAAIPGEIKMWSGSVLPDLSAYGHWVWADGTSYVKATYPKASAAIDNGWRTFGGAADPGASNFRVPDLRGVSPSGMDAMPGGARANRTTRAVAITLAGRTGEETHIITLPEVPAHNHAITDPGHTHVLARANTNSAGAGGAVQSNVQANDLVTLSAVTGITIQSAGGGGAHENMPPTVFVPYIVKLDD